MSAGGRVLKKGDIITIDGSTGEVLAGAVAMRQPELSGDFARLMEWADAARRLKVRANAETPADARAARSFGAEGIGLCRTEHMFFERGPHRRGARDDPRRRRGRPAGGARQAPADAARGFRRTVRDHDGPAGDDPPARPAAARIPAEDRRGDRRRRRSDGHRRRSELRERTQALHEFNPMLGHRGCRLAISYPEIAEMQARAIFEAAIEVADKTGEAIVPEIMVPLVAMRAELDLVKAHDRQGRRGGRRTGARQAAAIHGRHDDRVAARGARWRQDRRDRRVLLLRHQRPDADDLRHLARRRGDVPRRLHGAGHPARTIRS